MADLVVYIIFHKGLYEDNTAGFSKEELEVFRWVAVNEKVEKDIPAWLPKHLLLHEYKMPIHDPFQQMNNFYQNSVFFHLYKNPQLITSSYVGFAQYDMKFNKESMLLTKAFIRENPQDKICGFAFPVGIEHLFNGIVEDDFWANVFLKEYNIFYSTQHKFKELEDVPLFLLHTFIIPKEFFLRMMPFIESFLPSLMRALTWETRHLAGTLERIFALCISCGLIEGYFTRAVQFDVKNLDDQRFTDTLRGIE